MYLTEETLNKITEIADKFNLDSRISDVQPFGDGNINDTFLVTLENDNINKTILQRINDSVFPEPDLVMLNMCAVTNHIKARLDREDRENVRRWDIPDIYPTAEGREYFVDANKSVWRTLTYIEGARTFKKIQNSSHATETGYALGRFHDLVSDLDIGKLHDTLPGFHVTPEYLSAYDDIAGNAKNLPASPELSHCQRFVEARRSFAHILEDARDQNLLVSRPIHGDPKVDNIMIDDNSGKAVSIIDLDTVKPGLVQYDIGDCLRSGCNPGGEDPDDLGTVVFQTDFCRSILKGYLGEAKTFLTPADYDYIYESIRLIAFELGLRFFSDYLQGNIYFKASDAEHNLRRAMVQFTLTESIESQSDKIRKIIKELR